MRYILIGIFIRNSIQFHFNFDRIFNISFVCNISKKTFTFFINSVTLYCIKFRELRLFTLCLKFVQVLHEGNQFRKDAELVREADELWYHLLKSGDRVKLKQNAILNIDFLMTIVKGVSISYLRSILDLVRSQILDWEIELLYNMTKQSVHVVSQDPNELAIEILLWLKPFTIPITANESNISEKSKNNDSCLSVLVNDTYNWCNNIQTPILIPSNSWLNLPMPPQVAMITCSWNSITRAVSTPDSQHLIACEGKMLHFFNLPAKSIIKSFEGILF